MKDETKATVSIISIVLIFGSLFVLYHYSMYMQEKFENVAASFHKGEKIYCEKDMKWEIVSKVEGWENIGERFIKDAIIYTISDCDKNSYKEKN